MKFECLGCGRVLQLTELAATVVCLNCWIIYVPVGPDAAALAAFDIATRRPVGLIIPPPPLTRAHLS